MNEQAQYTPTSDDRLLAGLSHFMGLIVALIVWATQKDKSPYIRFQAIQAMAFELVVMIVIFVVVGCSMVGFFGLVALTTGGVFLAENSQNLPPDSIPFFSLMFGVPFFIPCLFLLVFTPLFVLRLIAAISTFQGKNFHYPLLGNWVENFLAH
jgi:uncharacterized Tic20 family protein